MRSYFFGSLLIGLICGCSAQIITKTTKDDKDEQTLIKFISNNAQKPNGIEVLKFGPVEQLIPYPHHKLSKNCYSRKIQIRCELLGIAPYGDNVVNIYNAEGIAVYNLNGEIKVVTVQSTNGAGELTWGNPN